MKSFVIPAIIAIVSFAGIILSSAGPSDHEAEKATSSWKQEATQYSTSDVEHMRRNGAFKK